MGLFLLSALTPALIPFAVDKNGDLTQIGYAVLCEAALYVLFLPDLPNGKLVLCTPRRLPVRLLPAAQT